MAEIYTRTGRAGPLGTPGRFGRAAGLRDAPAPLSRGRGAGWSGLGGRGHHTELQLLAVGGDVDLDLVTLRELGEQDLLRQRVLDEALDRPLERPGAEALVVAVGHEEVRS